MTTIRNKEQDCYCKLNGHLIADFNSVCVFLFEDIAQNNHTSIHVSFQTIKTYSIILLSLQGFSKYYSLTFI